jgi:hydroxylamine dehydrogenase
MVSSNAAPSVLGEIRRKGAKERMIKKMNLFIRRTMAAALPLALPAMLALSAEQKLIPSGEQKTDAANAQCVECHLKQSPALVMEWQRSRHAAMGVGCLDCHGAKKEDTDAWLHEGATIAALVTPKDCAQCHETECKEFERSHHARAGEILASLDNVLAEKAAGMPGNSADAVNGCWQCHGAIVKFQRDSKGDILHATNGKPLLDANTWPNSGIGRLNPDGSKGSCHACHSRHSFEAKLSRSPENCGKCHMGPDHPQIEIYNESKHGIAFYANRDKMALDKDGDWVLGKDYSAAPTCASCHIASYSAQNGKVSGNSHDVGERLSWTLRPEISVHQNLVVYTDGHKEDYPETRALPKIGDNVETKEKTVSNEKLATTNVTRKVASIITWQDRRAKMKGACLNCHNDPCADNFYKQFDDLVTLYNEKFARPAKAIMEELIADGVLKKNAPFEHKLQWTYYELWHHEGRRARHGASMMGPDYTHWHGMYEVSKHFYTEFLPEAVETVATVKPELKAKWEKRVGDLLLKDEHVWRTGLTPAEAEAIRKTAQERYNQ